MSAPYRHAITCSTLTRGSCYSACACWCHHGPTWPYLDMTRRVPTLDGGPHPVPQLTFTPEQSEAILKIGKAIGDSLRKVLSAYATALKPIAKALTEPPTDLQLALRDIRRVADRERRLARSHLNQRMDAMYAELGLERS